MDKQTQRARAIAARRAMPAEVRADASAALCRRLMERPELLGAKTVFSYLSMPEEADLSALHEWLLDRNCTVAFPVTQADGIMQAYAPDRPWRFEFGPFGIRAPIPAESELIPPEEIDLVLVPCVAFDSGCRRLGHGGGYYDRYLTRCPNAVRIGVAFETQRLPEIVCGGLDVPMHAFVTEQCVYRPKK